MPDASVDRPEVLHERRVRRELDVAAQPLERLDAAVRERRAAQDACCSSCSRCSGRSTRARSTTRCCSRRSSATVGGAAGRRSRPARSAARGRLHAVAAAQGLRCAGSLLAALLTAFASVSRIGADLLETLTSMFNPLPSIALLPLALIWFGLGDGSVIFVLVHAVLWAVALNTYAGFRALSPTLRMVGQNYGLSRARVHRADPDSGRVPEHPDGAQGRLGVRVAHADRRGARVRRQLRLRRPRLVHLRAQEPARIPDVFAGLLTVILFGLFVEHVIFRTIEDAHGPALGQCRPSARELSILSDCKSRQPAGPRQN